MKTCISHAAWAHSSFFHPRHGISLRRRAHPMFATGSRRDMVDKRTCGCWVRGRCQRTTLKFCFQGTVVKSANKNRLRPLPCTFCLKFFWAGQITKPNARRRPTFRAARHAAQQRPQRSASLSSRLPFRPLLSHRRQCFSQTWSIRPIQRPVPPRWSHRQTCPRLS